MLIKESLLEEILLRRDIHNNTSDYEEDEETLSLCDLPLYSDDQTATKWEESFSTESHSSSSISSPDHDYFEFSSQELGPSTTTTPPENIIFCGKLIHYKQPNIILKEDSSKLSEINNQTNNKKKAFFDLFSWKSTKTLKHKKDQQDSSSKKMYNDPLHKISIVTSSSSGKARWYLIFFGSSRFSMDVEWKDMKKRHSLRRCPSSPMFKFKNNDEMVEQGKNRLWGLWGLIAALSCVRNHQHHPNTMATVPIGYSHGE